MYVYCLSMNFNSGFITLWSGRLSDQPETLACRIYCPDLSRGIFLELCARKCLFPHHLRLRDKHFPYAGKWYRGKRVRESKGGEPQCVIAGWEGVVDPNKIDRIKIWGLIVYISMICSMLIVKATMTFCDADNSFFSDIRHKARRAFGPVSPILEGPTGDHG